MSNNNDNNLNNLDPTTNTKINLNNICFDNICSKYNQDYMSFNLITRSRNNEYLQLDISNNDIIKNTSILLYKYTKLSDDAIKTICKYNKLTLYNRFRHECTIQNINFDKILWNDSDEPHICKLYFNENNILHIFLSIWFSNWEPSCPRLWQILFNTIQKYNICNYTLLSKIITGYTYFIHVDHKMLNNNYIQYLYINHLIRPCIVLLTNGNNTEKCDTVYNFIMETLHTKYTSSQL